jgi:hypothetical protein
MDITISMRAADAVEHFTKALEEAKAAVRGAEGSPRSFEYTIYGKDERGGDVNLRFENDDMERSEMTGTTIVDID